MLQLAEQMKIKSITISHYEIPYTLGYTRKGALIKIEDEDGYFGTGDIAPLPQRSRESLQDALIQLAEKKSELLSVEWQEGTCLEQLFQLTLLPSLSFGMESALLSILKPVPACSIPLSALFIGNSSQEILKLAKLRQAEGFTNAKLKVGNLSLKEAFTVISEIKDVFRLRIDVNNAWSSSEALKFFSQFPLDAFDYVEDPVNFSDLKSFSRPYAVEEPLSQGISLSQLETLPNLKAIVYKPTVLGGILVGKALLKWAEARGIAVVLSSVLESDIGHLHLAAIAHRLGLTLPIGIGTYHYLGKFLSPKRLQISQGKIHLHPSDFAAATTAS